MMLLKLVWKNILHKKLSSFLCIFLMAIGIALISLINEVSSQFEDKFTKNISGIDMVVGAKGSPLQLILSSIFQIDSPTGNIPLSQVEALKNNMLIKQIIPLSIGDNHAGFRIVGTNRDYLAHFKGEISKGRVFEHNLDVVLGANVAEKLHLAIGNTFESAHGLDEAGSKHKEHHYKVVGILKANNSVIDNLIICNLESIWEMHHSEGQEITAALVKFRSPMGLMTIPRNINQNSTMQAALPSIEVNRLFKLLGVGLDAIKLLAIIIMAASGLSVFISLYNALKERKYEMALMLVMGASRLRLFLMLLLEGLILTFIGFAIGLLMAKVGLVIYNKIYGNIMNVSLNNFGKPELILLIGSLLIGFFAVILPAISIFKIKITETLANE